MRLSDLGFVKSAAGVVSGDTYLENQYALGKKPNFKSFHEAEKSLDKEIMTNRRGNAIGVGAIAGGTLGALHGLTNNWRTMARPIAKGALIGAGFVLGAQTLGKQDALIRQANPDFAKAQDRIEYEVLKKFYEKKV